MISESLTLALEEATSQVVRDSRRLHGGDVSDAYCVTFANEEKLFVKTHRNAPAGMFKAEAKGLQWLAKANALHIPHVVAYSSEDQTQAPFIALEYVEQGRTTALYDEQLGHGLAKLHQSGADTFGLSFDNFIAVLPQSNTPKPTWKEFYHTCRLEPLLTHATRKHLISTSLRLKFDALFSRMSTLVGPDEPPHRLHGDLWSGNALCNHQGKPCLIDPAVYGGHREMDLAMMHLFGGFRTRCFDAYHEAYPLCPGHAERIPLYQLYPLLVHVNLFGSSYIPSVENALNQLLR
jgi:fructosamine-3-kinase